MTSTTSSTSTASTSGSTITFSGIASGLDTTSIISALMAVEQAPQDALKTRLATEQAKLSAMQTLNSGIAAMGTSAASFESGSTWQSLTAKSSDSNISVTADSTASAASLTVAVTQRATAATLSFSDAHALTDVVATPSTTDAPNSLTLTLADGTTASVDTGDGTLKTILANLNALKGSDGESLVSAASVSLGDGTYRVLLTDAKTGEGTVGLSGDGLSLGTASSTAGKSAKITVGDIAVTSRSNTFDDVLPGVDIALGAGASSSTVSQVSVTTDATSRSTAVAAMISQLNSVLDDLSSATSYGTIDDTSSGTAASDAGVLAGDSSIRALANQLINTIYTSDGKGVLNDYGIEIDRDGQFTFDATTFAAAYAKDPSGVQEAIAGSDGFAARLVKAAKSISGTKGLQSDNTILASDGSLTQMISGMKSNHGIITTLNDEISQWDDRLTAKQASLQTQYTALETAMSKLTTQQSWLTSAIESLDSSD